MPIADNKRVIITATRGTETIHCAYDERSHQNQNPDGPQEVYVHEIDTDYGQKSTVTLRRKLVVDQSNPQNEQPHLSVLFGPSNALYTVNTIHVLHMAGGGVSPVAGYSIATPSRKKWSPPSTDGAGGEGSFETVVFSGGEAVELSSQELHDGGRYTPD